MNCRHASLLLLMAASALAQPSIKPPVVGAVRDSQGAIQTIVGVAGSFILADTGLPNAISAAFSSSAGLVKTDNELLVLNDNRDVVARFDAPSGPALLAFDCNGHPALVSYGDSLFQFRDGNLEPVNWTGDALSIASTAPDSAAILIRRVRQIWRVNISLPDGAVQSEAVVPEASLPAMLLPGGGLLFEREDELVARDDIGVERTIHLDFRAASLAPMGENWIAIRESGGRLFALCIKPDALELYQLPEVTQ